MSISPDTDVIYQEAIDLQERVEIYQSRRISFLRLVRDRKLDLLERGMFNDLSPDAQLEAIDLKVNQLLEIEYPEVFDFLDSESAKLAAINARNEAIVAAGWAETFAASKAARELQNHLYTPPTPDKQIDS